MTVLLASGSPQRSAILTQLGVPFRVWVPDVDEVAEREPEQVARTNARAKCDAGLAQARGGEIVVAVDTIVVLDGRVYGKPRDLDDARDMLGLLRGRTHTVISALAMHDGDALHELAAHTRVTFRTFTDAALADYLAGMEWDSRAGGYAIQGTGAALVAAIDGDYLNVVGFPVAAFLDCVDALGLRDRLFAS
jgi:septum formation protein